MASPMVSPLVELCFGPAQDGEGPASGAPTSRTLRTPPSAGTEIPDNIVGKIRAGDESAFAALFRVQYPRLVRLAAVYVDADAAADVVVEVFSAIWNARTEWAPANIDAFLYRAVRNRALNHQRGNLRELRRRDAYEHITALHHVDRADARQLDGPADEDPRTTAVRRAVAELNPRQREFVVLRWQDGRTPAEIAELLGTTVRAITSLQDRTLAILRRRARELLAGTE